MEIKRGDIWYVSKDNYTGCEQAAGARQSSSPTRRTTPVQRR